MTNRRLLPPASAFLLLAAGVALTLPGCTEEEPPPVVVAPPPAPPPPPPPPPLATVADLMKELNIDPRVSMDERFAPDTTEKRRAVLQFFDAFARGDATRAGAMMSAEDKTVLDDLVASGDWGSSTRGIDLIEVRAGIRPEDGKACALAIFTVGDGEQAGLWAYELDAGTASFAAEPTPPNVMERLSGEDLIAAWYDMLEKYLALAQKPDVDLEAPKENMTQSSPTDAAGEEPPPDGGGGGGGGGGGAAPMRRRSNPDGE